MVRRLVTIVTCGALAVGCDGDGDGDGKTQVTLSGVAYTFNMPDPVVGAEVRLVELPDAVATTAADGSWSLTVRTDGELTPYVTHAEYVTMHLQTFVDPPASLARVNFQMVKPAVYDTLALVLGITPDPARCQIASTVSEKAIQAMTFDEFKAHGAHGVADATVTIDPPGAEVVYFNEQVIPDKSRTTTSRDGGVVWTNVPPGRYTITATHATRSFAPITIACQAGRFINANPPQGLREL